jgi:hypothetical protein
MIGGVTFRYTAKIGGEIIGREMLRIKKNK